MTHLTPFRLRAALIHIFTFILSIKLLLLQSFAFDIEKHSSDETTGKAERSMESLIENYWNDDLRMFNNQSPCNACNQAFHYWWQAHAMDVLLDGYEITGDDQYLQYVKEMNEGLLERNGGDLFNDYYDDMLWMGLALLRVHELDGDEIFLKQAKDLWSEIESSWNDEFGGGFPWRTTQTDYKNAPANGPAVILSARLYRLTQEDEYLKWAKKTYTWLKENLVNPETGLVWDGINREGNAVIDKNWLFTYNQGTFTGAAVELWRITGDQKYLNDAKTNMQATLKDLTDENDIFTESGQGDGGLFKGILVRYFMEYDNAVNGDPELRRVLLKNAVSVWDSKTDSGIYGPNWSEEHSGTIDLSSHLSGVKLLVLTNNLCS